MSMISIEQFAKLSAQVEAGTPLPRVLQDAKLAPQQWLAAQRRWLTTLTREAQLGGGPNGKRYLSAFMHSSATPAGSGAAETTAAPNAAPPLAAPIPAAPAPSAAMPSGPAPAAPAPTAPVPSAPSPTAPFSAPAAALTGAAPAQPPGRRPHRTSAMQAMSPIAILTPFARDAAAQAPPSAAASIAQEAAGLVGGTTAVAALSDEELQDDGLPFETSDEMSVDTTGAIAVLDIDEPDLPFTTQGSAPPPTAASIEQEATALAGETAFISALSDDELEAATPFDEPTGGEPSPAAAAPAAAAPAAASTASSTSAAAAHPTSMPFPRLTVQQYASLSVDLHSTGSEPRAATLQRYGMADETQLAALIAAWNTHFRNHPGDYGRFRAAYDQYSAWLKSRGT